MGAAQTLVVDDQVLRARLESDEGWSVVEVQLPAVVSCAERLCSPCKSPAAARAEVPHDRIRVVGAHELGAGPWGAAGSPTVVGQVRQLESGRERRRLRGGFRSQVRAAVGILGIRGVLDVTDAGPVIDMTLSRPGSKHLRGSPEGRLRWSPAVGWLFCLSQVEFELHENCWVGRRAWGWHRGGV